MKQLTRILLLILFAGLSSGCAVLSGFFEQNQENALLEELKNSSEAHPLGATYALADSSGRLKKLSVFYNGKGIARLLDQEQSSENCKVIINYQASELRRKNFDTEEEELETIDYLQLPPVINNKAALEAKARFCGRGLRNGFPYHRWSKEEKDGEWEVWIDDRDSFPIYYRAVKNGEILSWTMTNAWIDESTENKPSFFTLEADPLPPAEDPENSKSGKANVQKPAQEHKGKGKHKKQLSKAASCPI